MSDIPKPPAVGTSTDSSDVLSFPMAFPIKIMGKNIDGFADTVAGIIQKHVPGFEAHTLVRRLSREGTYLALTAQFTAQSREQLDNLYRELTSHPMVSYVL
ncbi:MAG: DUF493 domain-containing protein [Lautropia sp.]|nr:DUF493 domain-containing protein [Lautropia sp.]